MYSNIECLRFGLLLWFCLRCEHLRSQIASDVGRAMRATKTRGGGAQPPPRGFPRATFLRGRVSGESVNYGVRFCFGLVSGLFSFGVCFVICGLVREPKNGQVLGHNSWGRCFVLALCQVLHLGAVAGGSLEPLVPRSP